MNRFSFGAISGASVILSFCSAASPAQDGDSRPGASKPVSDLAALRAGSQTFVSAFNRGNANGVAALQTESGDCIDDTGQRLESRDAIESAYAEFFKRYPGAKITIAIDSLRLLSADAALEDGRAILDPPPEEAPALIRFGKDRTEQSLLVRLEKPTEPQN